MDKDIEDTLELFEKDQKTAREIAQLKQADSLKQHEEQAKRDINLLENDLAPALEQLADNLKQGGHKMEIEKSWSTHTTPRMIGFEFRPNATGADSMKRLKMSFRLSTSGSEDRVLVYTVPWDGKETHIPEEYPREKFDGQQLKRLAWEAIKEILLATKDLG